MCLTALYEVGIVHVGSGITQTKVQGNPYGALGQFLGLCFSLLICEMGLKLVPYF